MAGALKKAATKTAVKKTIKQMAALGLASGAIIFGAFNSKPMETRIQRGNVEKIINTKGKNLEVHRLKSDNPRLIRETVNFYNKKAKLGEIYFYDGKSINSVHLDKAKLSQLVQIIPKNEKAEIDSLIARKIRAVEATAKENVILSKKIIDRVGELDYKKYLLSLTPEQLVKVLPEATQVIRRALENSNPEVLKQINNQENMNNQAKIIGSVLIGLTYGIFLSTVISSSKKSK